MAKLSDTQLIVLAAALARDDGYAVIPETMKPGAVTKVGAGLVARKLMREIRAKPGMPVWYTDDSRRGLTLVITAAGRKAIGIEDDAEVVAEVKLEANAGNERKSVKAASEAGVAKAPQEGVKPTASEAVTGQCTAFREGSKSALLVEMLSAKNGVTLGALEDATGWLPHTMRAALTGLRKRGYAISRDRRPGENATYRIAMSA